MPKGKAPFPSKANVDAGKADKARAVRGGYERADTTNPGVSRTIVTPNVMGKKKVAFGESLPGPGPDEDVNFNRMKYAKGGIVKGKK